MILERLKAGIKSVPLLSAIYDPIAKAYDRRGRNLAYARRRISSIPAEVAEPIFVKVGAHDGVTGDPLSDILFADCRWKGLLIEPVPYCFERLTARFGDNERFFLEKIAIGAGTATTFYYVAENAAKQVAGVPESYDQLGSFDKNHIRKHFDGALAPFIVECQVEVRPLTEVLARNGIEEFHLLHIDTEGSDLEVLRTLDLENVAPLAVFVEHKHLPAPDKEAVVCLLRKHGYAVRDCGTDYFALRT